MGIRLLSLFKSVAVFSKDFDHLFPSDPPLPRCSAFQVRCSASFSMATALPMTWDSVQASRRKERAEEKKKLEKRLLEIEDEESDSEEAQRKRYVERQRTAFGSPEYTPNRLREQRRLDVSSKAKLQEKEEKARAEVQRQKAKKRRKGEFVPASPEAPPTLAEQDEGPPAATPALISTFSIPFPIPLHSKTG